MRENHEPSGKEKRWILMSHALTRAAHGLTLTEKRVLAMAVAALDQKRAKTLPRSIVVAAEYAETYGVDATSAYEQLKAAAYSLMRKHIRIIEDDGAVEIRRQWVIETVYRERQGRIEIEWSQYVAPHLLELKSAFSRYKLSQAAALRSVYAWRLLELISMHRDTGWLQIPIEDFARAMDATPAQRKDFARIRVRMILPAIRELKEKDGLDVAWEPIKEGRKVAALKFTFAPEKQKRLPLDGKPRPQGAAIAPRNMDKAQAESAAAASQAAARTRLPTQFVLDHSLPDEPFHVAELRLSLAIRKGEIQPPGKAQDK